MTSAGSRVLRGDVDVAAVHLKVLSVVLGRKEVCLGDGGNPTGADGQQMRCHGCGSTEHLIAKCPQKKGKGKGRSYLVDASSQSYMTPPPPYLLSEQQHCSSISSYRLLV